jgi:predicted RNA-binding Zn ribbon-like protein
MLQSVQRPDPFFLADHRALDFLNSVATPQDERIDWLADGPSLLNWLSQGFGVSTAAVDGSREANAMAARARTLREWFRGFVAKHAGTPLTSGAARTLKPLNEVLASDHIYQQIVAGDGDEALVLRAAHRPNTPNAMLQPIAQAIADLVCHADFTNVRHCEGAGCTFWFLDTSKAHRRRWCSMAICGNRAKVAQHRARQRRKA